MVKALMPAAHCEGGRLWRTSAVVEATTDKNTPPNNSPEANTSGQALNTAGMTAATPSKPLSKANGCPPL
jgi:hypothetical protein